MNDVLNFAAAVAVAAMLSGAGYAAQADKPSDDEGHKLLVKVCGSCHKVDMVTNRRGTREEWEATIAAMVDKGADGSDEDFNAVLDYLTRNYGHDRPGGQSAVAAKLNINKAAAKEIATFLAVPETDGAAIVRYREANGAFKSWEDLVKVPGVDAKKFEAKKNRIVY
jgi:competence protein ComEA